MKNIKYKLLKIISGIFYSRKYLCGKFFDTSSIGFKWVLKCWFAQKIQGINKQIPWPVSPGNTVVGPKENIEFCIDNLDNFQGTGVYFQCFAAKLSFSFPRYPEILSKKSSNFEFIGTSSNMVFGSTAPSSPVSFF